LVSKPEKSKSKGSKHGSNYIFRQGQVVYASYFHSGEISVNSNLIQYRVWFLEKEKVEQLERSTFDKHDNWVANQHFLW